jgi:hypothetical protein
VPEALAGFRPARHTRAKQVPLGAAPDVTVTAGNAAQGQEIIPNGSVLRPQDLAVCPGLITPGVLSWRSGAWPLVMT